MRTKVILRMEEYRRLQEKLGVTDNLLDPKKAIQQFSRSQGEALEHYLKVLNPEIEKLEKKLEGKSNFSLLVKPSIELSKPTTKGVTTPNSRPPTQVWAHSY